ncbi:MAG: DUF429 domain-containing protein [Trueperaceae bacterium]|nr:MAG: DUF429 domain-containing protein [Trueperaceae bacterium]
MDSPCIVGIDCATVAERVGLALAVPDGDGWRLVDVTTGSAARPPAAVVGAWLIEWPNALLALDAPLGWPAALGDALGMHRAGAPIAAPADALFRRATDRSVHARYGKLPLEVGADRIARTARAALAMLDELGAARGAAIPLTWRPDVWPRAVAGGAPASASPSAIEVYPAATLRAYGAAERGYTQPGGAARSCVAAFARGRVRVPAAIELESLPADAFDAVLCVVAGIDAARGEAAAPDDEALARREGWIWVRAPRIDRT